jgi:hypothetical protein
MKIVFFCSSLEPGHDGVGDYTRRLAGGLIKNGNTIAIIALNDKQTDSVFTCVQQSEGVDIEVMRIPSSLPESERARNAKKYVDQFDPEWLSLQFVPFGFHPKGLKLGLSKFLLSIGGARPWHIMFHELWVGMAAEESKKLLWWGRLQRMLIKTLVLILHPKVIHTQSILYQALLNKMGFNVQLLPLFGNITVNDLSSKDNSFLKKNEISFVVFGSIHSGAPIAEFAKEAAAYSLKNNIPVKLIFIGRYDLEHQRWSTIWKAEGLSVEAMGEQSAAYISEVLTNPTAGISATAIAVIDKSGSVAAMLEHGMPVISVSKPWTPNGVPTPKTPAGVIAYHKGNFEDCLAYKSFIPGKNDVSAIATKFTASLLNAL